LERARRAVSGDWVLNLSADYLVRAGPRLDRGVSHVSIFPTLNISTWFLGFAQQGSLQ
jgi:hypothetical protein